MDYKELFDISPDGIVLVGTDGYIIQANKAQAIMYGYESAAEMTGVFATDLIASSTVRISEHFASLARGKEEILPIEYEVIRKNGTIFWVEITASALRNKKNELTGYLCFTREITGRKLAEKAGLEREQKFKSVFMISTDAMYIATLEDGRIIEINNAYTKLFGYSREEALGKTSSQLNLYYNSEDRSKVVNEFNANNQISDLELKGRRKGGDLIIISLSARILEIDKRKLQVGVLKDITDAKHKEEALQKSESKYRRLHESMVDAFASTDMNGKITECNKSFTLMLGYTEEELYKMKYTDITPSVWHKYEENIVREQVLKTGYSGVYTKEYRRKDGSVFPVELRTFLTKDDMGQSTLLWAIVRDISERKAAEEIIKENSSRLELAMQAANMAWWGMDVITGNVTFDKRKSDMLGYPQEKFKHYTDFMELIHPEDYDGVMQAMLNHINGKAMRYACEYRVLTGSGDYLWFYDVGSVVRRGSKGEPLNVVGIVIDINERKKIEKELLLAKEKAEKSEKDLVLLNQHLQEVRETERALISREIHDQLGQSLTALKIDLNWLQRKTRTGIEIKDKLNAMTDLVTDTIKDVQRISSELRPSILDDIGLAAAMEWYCEDFSTRTGLTVKMEFEDIQIENMNSNLALYRVLQESLTNIIRHANAKTATVKLSSSLRKIILLIHDDGIGIPDDKIKSSNSLGLLGMFERIKYAGGQMNISNPATGGTRILVEIPLETTKNENINCR